MEYIQPANFPQEIVRKSNSDFDDPKHTENPDPKFQVEGIKMAQGATGSASVVGNSFSFSDTLTRSNQFPRN